MNGFEELKTEINDLRKEIYFFKKELNDRISLLEKNKKV